MEPRMRIISRHVHRGPRTRPIISSGDDELTAAHSPNSDTSQLMFAFFSNRLGCLGSIAVSIIGTIVLLFLVRGCHL